MNRCATLFEGAGVDPEVGELADVGGRGMILKARAAERLVVVGRGARLPRPRLHPVVPVDGGKVDGRRHDTRSTASSRGCTPLFLKAVPHRIGHQVTLDDGGACADATRLNSSSVSSLVFEVLLGEVVGQRSAMRLRARTRPGTPRPCPDQLGSGMSTVLRTSCPQVLLVGGGRPHEGLHLDQVDDAGLKSASMPIGQLDDHNVGAAQTLLDLSRRRSHEVGTGAIELVDEAPCGARS